MGAKELARRENGDSQQCNNYQRHFSMHDISLGHPLYHAHPLILRMAASLASQTLTPFFGLHHCSAK